ncbi:MAG: Ppx/GppA family phosphatase, partial [Acidimicrobiales bacterium]
SEIEIIAQVARYHRKSAPKASHEEFQELSGEHKSVVRTLAGLLRIAIALDRTRQGVVEALDVSVTDDEVSIGVVVADGADLSLEVYTAEQRKRLLSSVLRRDVNISVVGQTSA